MSKSNKKKNARDHGSKLKIEEPDFKVNLDPQVVSTGNKKLLAQLERERKEKEEEERINREKQEADKKKKNNKGSSNKTKSKQNLPKNKEEEKPVRETTQPEKIRNENVQKETSYQETRKPINTRNENEVTTQKNTWSQENTSNPTENDDSWNWEGNVDPSRFQKKLEIGKPNHSNYKQNANNQNNFDSRNSYNYTFSDGKNDKEFQKFLDSRRNFGGKVREQKGDLFEAPSEYSLAHCVAEDFSMGAGIAKEFRAKFKRVSKLLDQNVKTGGLAVLEDESRFIYYLVTKMYSRGKPTLYTLWKSLLKLRDHITKHKVTKLAIPQIGCGLDRLDWSQVKWMLEYIFSENEVDIVVYILDFNLKRPRSMRSSFKTQNQFEYIPSRAKKHKLDSKSYSSHPNCYEMNHYNTVIISDSETSDQSTSYQSYLDKKSRVYNKIQNKFECIPSPDKKQKLDSKSNCSNSNCYEKNHYNTVIYDSETSDQSSSDNSNFTNKMINRNRQYDFEKKRYKHDLKFSRDGHEHKNHSNAGYSDSKKSHKNIYFHQNVQNCNKSSLQVVEHDSTHTQTQNNDIKISDTEVETGKYKKDKTKRENAEKHKHKKSKHSKSNKNKKHR